MGWPKPVLIYVGRTILGVLLAVALSVIGIGIAWGMFVFWGGSSHATLLILFMAGAGLGAGLGSLLAWVRIDHLPSKPIILIAALVVGLVGVVGGWGGFQFGTTQEVECCVGPAIEPITYTVIGAVLATNVISLVLSLVYEAKVGGGWAKFRRTGGGDSTMTTTGQARHLPN